MFMLTVFRQQNYMVNDLRLFLGIIESGILNKVLDSYIIWSGRQCYLYSVVESRSTGR